jgi:hypothetical protein
MRQWCTFSVTWTVFYMQVLWLGVISQGVERIIFLFLLVILIWCSWLQIQRSQIDSRRYQIFWEVVGLEQGPLSLVRITEELLEWKSSVSGSRKPRLTAVGIRCADHASPLSTKVGNTPKSGGRSIGIVRLRTKSTELIFYLLFNTSMVTFQYFFSINCAYLDMLYFLMILV